MTTTELIKALRGQTNTNGCWNDGCWNKCKKLMTEAADRLEEQDERVAIMQESIGKRYGSYALFDPDSTREEREDAIKKVAADQLIRLGVLKLHFNDFPEPVENEDGSVSFYVAASWTAEMSKKLLEHEGGY